LVPISALVDLEWQQDLAEKFAGKRISACSQL